MGNCTTVLQKSNNSMNPSETVVKLCLPSYFNTSRICRNNIPNVITAIICKYAAQHFLNPCNFPGCNNKIISLYGYESYSPNHSMALGLGYFKSTSADGGIKIYCTTCCSSRRRPIRLILCKNINGYSGCFEIIKATTKSIKACTGLALCNHETIGFCSNNCWKQNGCCCTICCEPIGKNCYSSKRYDQCVTCQRPICYLCTDGINSDDLRNVCMGGGIPHQAV